MSHHRASPQESSDLVFVDMHVWWRRLLAVTLAVFAVAGAWRAGQWFIGNAVALNAFDREGADAALRLAPDDPQAHYTMGVLVERRADGFDPVINARTALPYYERAAELSPHDYRLWAELGRVYERVGDTEKATTALRRAIELAPNYGNPRWLLGNILLRAGQADAGFAELRNINESDAGFGYGVQEYGAQVIKLAWRYYDGDINAVMRALGDRATVKAGVLSYLISNKRLSEALKAWESMDEAAVAATSEPLARALFEAKRFRNALTVHQAAARARAAAPQGQAAQTALAATNTGFEQIANGDFEAGVPPPGTTLFGWQIARIPQAQVELDATERQSGARSLRLTFTASGALDLRGFRQLVVVEPGARYRLKFHVRAEDLRSASLPLIEVAHGISDATLGASQPAPMNAREWQEEIMEFTTPADTDGIVVRFGRAACSDAVCPIFGRAWYDNFSLERVRETNGRR